MSNSNGGEVRERYVKSFLDVIIASTLKDGDLDNHEITAKLHEKLQIRPNHGAVYSTVYFMEKKGLIVSYVKNKKKFYRLTNEGIRWLSQMGDTSQHMNVVTTFFAT